MYLSDDIDIYCVNIRFPNCQVTLQLDLAIVSMTVEKHHSQAKTNRRYVGRLPIGVYGVLPVCLAIKFISVSPMYRSLFQSWGPNVHIVPSADFSVIVTDQT